MISFLHSFYKGISRGLERNTHDFLLCFVLRFLLYSFHFCTDITLDFLHIFSLDNETNWRKVLAGFEKTFDGKFPALPENLVAPNLCT
jgi:hypothetical protein